MKRGREGRFTHIRVHLLRILWKEGGEGRGVYTDKDPSIEDPMEREGGFAHIRVHLFRILWREE